MLELQGESTYPGNHYFWDSAHMLGGEDGMVPEMQSWGGILHITGARETIAKVFSNRGETLGNVEAASEVSQ